MYCFGRIYIGWKFVRHIFTNNLCDTKYWYLLYASNEELLFDVSEKKVNIYIRFR